MIEAPPWDLIERFPWAYREFVERSLWALRSDPSARVTSWFRDARRNAEVGGAQWSQHRLGFALDVLSEKPQLLAAEFRRVGLIPVVERSHVHVQAFRAGTLPHSLFLY